MTTVHIEYFAQLREQAGRSQEVLQTAAASLRLLYEELATRHGFSLPSDTLKVAVNARFADWAQAPEEGDVIVFIPPVAGG